jgi:hypothetical protein
MATRIDNPNPPQGQQAQRAIENVGSPIANEAYDVLTALQAKLEGLEAYRKYSFDGNEQFWRRLSDLDNQMVGMLCDELERLSREGGLRRGTPGKSLRPTPRA